MWAAVTVQGRALATAIFKPVFVQPFEWLYREGPVALGFWGGLTPPDICAQLTNTHAHFWNATDPNRQECLDLIDRHFWSWMVLAAVVGYVSAMGYGVHRLCAKAPAPIQMIMVKTRRSNKKTSEGVRDKTHGAGH